MDEEQNDQRITEAPPLDPTMLLTGTMRTKSEDKPATEVKVIVVSRGVPLMTRVSLDHAVDEEAFNNMPEVFGYRYYYIDIGTRVLTWVCSDCYVSTYPATFVRGVKFMADAIDCGDCGMEYIKDDD